MNLLQSLPVLIMFACGPAHAQSAVRVDLNGSIAAGTCTIAAVTKTMPTVPASGFPQTAASNTGIVASYTPFELSLRSCSGVTGATFVFGTTADAEPLQNDSFRNKAANGAAYVAIWVRETAACNSGTTIRPGGTLSRDIATATLSIPLCAQYFKMAGGLVTMGPLTTNFTITVTYR